MAINNITSTNYVTAIQMAGRMNQTPSATDASSATESYVPKASPAYDDIPGRIAAIPDLGDYEAMIQRFLSGESAMEDPGSMAPLTEDQIALREFMRAYQRTDPRSLTQIRESMERGSQSFFEYWQANGNGAPMPGRLIKPDGSFVIFSSKAEKDAYMKDRKLDFLREAKSVIADGNGSGAVVHGLDRMA